MIIKRLLELSVSVHVRARVSIRSVVAGCEAGICSIMQYLCRSVLNLDGCV